MTNSKTIIIASSKAILLLWSFLIGSVSCQQQQPRQQQDPTTDVHSKHLNNNPDENAFWVVGDESNTWSEMQWENWWKKLEEKLLAHDHDQEDEDGSATIHSPRDQPFPPGSRSGNGHGTSNGRGQRNNHKRRDWPEWGGNSANINVPFSPLHHYENQQQHPKPQQRSAATNVHPSKNRGLDPNSRFRDDLGYGGAVRGASPPP